MLNNHWYAGISMFIIIIIIKLTIKDKFTMPHPDMLFDKLKGAMYFTKLDLSQGSTNSVLLKKTELRVLSLLVMEILSGLWLPSE